MDFESIREYGSAGVSVVSIYAIYWIVCKFLKFLKESEERHIASYEKLDKTLEKNTEVVGETKTFMVRLNGKLEKAVRDKVS